MGQLLDSLEYLLDKLEEMLQQRLPDLYSELNGLLEHHRVEAAQVQIRQRGSSSGTPGASGNAPTAPPPMNALASLQQAIGRQFGAPTAGNLPAASGVTGAVGFGNAVLDGLIEAAEPSFRIGELGPQRRQAAGKVGIPFGLPLH